MFFLWLETEDYSRKRNGQADRYRRVNNNKIFKIERITIEFHVIFMVKSKNLLKSQPKDLSLFASLPVYTIMKYGMSCRIKSQVNNIVFGCVFSI